MPPPAAQAAPANQHSQKVRLKTFTARFAAGDNVAQTCPSGETAHAQPIPASTGRVMNAAAVPTGRMMRCICCFMVSLRIPGRSDRSERRTLSF